MPRFSRDPVPYDINDPDNMVRLHRELYSYMKISINDGTDRKGRDFALEALGTLVKRDEQTPPTNK